MFRRVAAHAASLPLRRLAPRPGPLPLGGAAPAAQRPGHAGAALAGAAAAPRGERAGAAAAAVAAPEAGARAPPGAAVAAPEASADAPPGLAALRMGEVPPWAFFGCSFNAVMLIAGDLIDLVFAAKLGLSPLAASGLASTLAAAGGVSVLQLLPGVLDMPDRVREPEAWRAKIQGRLAGLFMGFALGLFPLFWPDEWRLWRKGAAAVAQRRRDPLTAEEQAVALKCTEEFPTAVTGPPLEEAVYRSLAARGWNTDNTLFAHASCPDEVNYDDAADLANLLSTRWGKRFTLGGLAGMSFSGKTGWGAFSAHTPKDGKIFILYGPHVGIGNSGAFSKIRRQGQAHDSTCCGAAVAAYSATKVPSGENWVVDMEQMALTRLLAPYRKKIAADPEPMKALAYANFEISHDYIREQISKPEGVCKEIAVLGGIMVNLPGDVGDRFVPITFEVLDCSTGRHEDLFASLGLGQAAPHRFGTSERRRPFFEPHAAAIAGAPGA